jgi:ABC-type lipoprotein export system ATPase subunit
MELSSTNGTAGDAPKRALIEVEDLTKRYMMGAQEVWALDGVTLSIEEGDYVAGMSKRERRERAAEVLESVGLGDRLDHRPNELSGGQRQRVATARALVNRPSLLLADEPTGNLDTETGAEIMQLLEALHRQGNTILVVTHEEPIAHHARRIIHLRDGKLEQDESVDQPVLADEDIVLENGSAPSSSP